MSQTWEVEVVFGAGRIDPAARRLVADLSDEADTAESRSSTMYPHLDDPDHWTLPEVLTRQAETHPDKPFMRMVGGECVTYGELLDQTRRVAQLFSSLGVGPGDRVAVLLPNSLDFVRAWTGLAWLGAVFVPVNTALVGEFLAHQLRSSRARVVVCHTSLWESLEAVRDTLPADLVALRSGEDGDQQDDPTTTRFDRWRQQPAHPGVPTDHRDIACLMFTSGTTGPSKGVLMPHAHCFLFGLGMIEAGRLSAEDHYYITMPFFHVNALFMQVYATLIAGASSLARPKFSARAWSAEVRDSRATVTNLIGMMSHSLMAQSAAEGDADNTLRLVVSVPCPPEHDTMLKERYGVPAIISLYGMTEVNIPIWGRIDDQRPGAAGFVYDRYFDVQIVDPETDRELPRGQIGEIVVRPKAPFGFMTGYDQLPEKTVETWRNLWFHTGDAAWMDETRCVTFVDRIKDCIRRGGENISSFELEAAIGQLDGVAEVAAFAVPAEGTEDEVMIAVVAAEGRDLDPALILEQTTAVVPRFAVPRYIDIVDSLPKTQTERLQKEALRRRGVTSSTWDRKVAVTS